MGILIFSAGIISAQEDVVGVETYISKKGIHAGNTFKVALLVQISPGWHIHAHELMDDFLIPTDLMIDENEKISISKYYYPEPISEKFDYSDNELQIYDGDTLFGALIKTGKDLSPESDIPSLRSFSRHLLSPGDPLRSVHEDMPQGYDRHPR